MNPYAEPLAWALVNFVWQGAALALAAFLVIRWIRPSAGVRYATGVVTLALMLLAPVVTFALLARAGNAAAVAPAPASQVAEPPAADSAATPTEPSTSTAPQFAAPALVLAVWLTGVAVFSLRLLGGWVVARRLVTRAVRPVAPEIVALARRVAGRLALDRVVRIVESSSVSVPMMVGWLKPVVLLPAVALSGLTPTQLEALLAHELAHVRRHDYLVNLLQSAVETLLFYHPAVWWVSKQVRAEREHCCDDLVVGVCDRVIYVSALTDLAVMSVPRPALAATDGSLLTRVRRILGRTDASTTASGGWISVFVALFVVGAIAPMATAKVSQAGQGGAVIKEVAGQGVAGGVPGGGTSGVSGGVPGSVAVIYEQGTASAEQARQRELEAAAARLQAAEAQLHSVNQERSGLDRMKVEGALKQQRMALEVELRALRQEFERSKRLYDVGLLNAGALATIEQRMHQAELKLAGVHSELDIKMFELEMRDRDAKARQALELRKAEFDLARSATEARDAIGGQDPREAAEARSRLAQLQRQMEELRRAIEQMDKTERPMERETQEIRRAAELLRQARGADEARRMTATAQSRDSRLLMESEPVTGSNETIRAGDVLSVDIKGEPDLPRAYAVQSNGTIRLPLIGSIKVAGLTAQQAGQAIAKQIARVNSSAAVHVSLRRGGSEQRRER